MWQHVSTHAWRRLHRLGKAVHWEGRDEERSRHVAAPLGRQIQPGKRFQSQRLVGTPRPATASAHLEPMTIVGFGHPRTRRRPATAHAAFERGDRGGNEPRPNGLWNEGLPGGRVQRKGASPRVQAGHPVLQPPFLRLTERPFAWSLAVGLQPLQRELALGGRDLPSSQKAADKFWSCETPCSRL